MQQMPPERLMLKTEYVVMVGSAGKRSVTRIHSIDLTVDMIHDFPHAVADMVTHRPITRKELIEILSKQGEVRT